jgi:hypothetical protein
VNNEMTAADAQVAPPDVLLPMQFVGALRQLVLHRSGEYRLLVAVLADAVRCFQQYAFARDYYGRQLFNEAEQWILGCDVDSEGALSFEYICAVLNLDSECLRQGLRRWREARLRSDSAGAAAIPRNDTTHPAVVPTETSSCCNTRVTPPS